MLGCGAVVARRGSRWAGGAFFESKPAFEAVQRIFCVWLRVSLGLSAVQSGALRSSSGIHRVNIFIQSPYLGAWLSMFLCMRAACRESMRATLVPWHGGGHAGRVAPRIDDADTFFYRLLASPSPPDWCGEAMWRTPRLARASSATTKDRL